MGGKTRFQEFCHEFAKMFTWSYMKGLIVNPAQLTFTALALVVAELIINILVVERVPYTEIDWKAYMQECEGFLNGTLDYSQLRGDTGPLVYPAGFYVQKQVQPQIDAKNLENKRQSKLKKEMKKKLNKKNEEQENLTKEQEDFLNSFEGMLQKSSQKGGKKAVKKPLDQDKDPHYSLSPTNVPNL
ncbi:hypothetical protein SFRURICE_000821 [Spodoptera frugiperda]|nr:hypothetical protein SFRURICE_000821 [Spodoptera frugiperda]